MFYPGEIPKAVGQRQGRIPEWRMLWFGLLILLAGCETPYYWHLINGQTRILLGRQSIDQLLEDPDLEPDLRKRFEFVNSVLAFARDDIGLATTSNYTYFFDTKGQPVGWNTSASPPDRFEPYLWDFPFVGKLPYKGFFAREHGERERDRLQGLGLDAILSPISAYSTLGFFSDPVFSPMLTYSEDRLADLILHELTHSTVYVENHIDFNESLATFVGRSGSLEILAQYYGPGTQPIEQVRRRRDDEARFNRFIGRVITSLDSLYNSGLSRDSILTKREMVFEQAKESYLAMRGEFHTDNFDGFLQWELNNARLLSYRRYHRNMDEFEKILVHKNGDLAEAIKVYKACAKEPDPWGCIGDFTIEDSSKVGSGASLTSTIHIQ